MAYRSLISKVLPATNLAQLARQTTGHITSGAIERKEFSPRLYDNLPDAGTVEKLFRERNGNAAVREHVMPLLKRRKLEDIFAPCLIYKHIHLGEDERIVIDERDKLTIWKVRDFLGQRDQARPEMLYFSERAYTICEYTFSSANDSPRIQRDVDQDPKSLGEIYRLLRMYDLDSIVGLRWISKTNKASLDAESAAFFT